MPEEQRGPTSSARAEFGRRLRRLREEKGLSQEAFADLAGVHRTYVSGVELGRRNVSLEIIARLAYALDVAVAELFRDEA